MKVRRKIDKNGVITTDNYILDEVIDTLNEFGINNDELIKKLAIQKMKYGIRCAVQCGISKPKSTNELVDALKVKIKELGGMFK